MTTNAERGRKWRKDNPEKAKAIAKRSREKHKEERREESRRRYRQRLEEGKCGICGKRPRRGISTRCQVCLDRANSPGSARKQATAKRSRANYNRKLRQGALDHYGHACVCCGIESDVFLTIDHVAGNGAEHRRELKHTGYTFLRWLRDEGYPDDFQVLCWNCNSAKHILGVCPHQSSGT